MSDIRIPEGVPSDRPLGGEEHGTSPGFDNEPEEMASDDDPSHPSIFHCFPRLPPELQHQVWQAALGGHVGPACFPYKQGCWQTRRLTAGDIGYSDEDDELNLNLEFRYEMLDHMTFELPMALVSHEARRVAMDWILSQGMPLTQPCGERFRGPVFSRGFRKDSDILLVKTSRWEEFVYESVNRCFQPDLYNTLITVGSEVKHIAFHEELLLEHDLVEDTFEDLFQSFCCIETIFVIVSTSPAGESAVHAPGAHGSWRREIGALQGGAFVWNDDRARFDYHCRKLRHMPKGHEPSTEAFEAFDTLFVRFERFIESLTRGIIQNGYASIGRTYEIRPVSSTALSGCSFSQPPLKTR